ncbi:MAG: PA14 domain-containing protein [Alphaproteobacteria bacterium]
MRVRFAEVITAAFLAGSLSFGASTAMAADLVSGLQPATPQPAAADLKPGLAVTYCFGVFNDTREIEDWAKYKDGVKGEPILILDYFVGDGDVLTSGRADEVGADIRGYINFPMAGTYTIAMRSNDGVDLKIGGVRVVHDPDVHSDSFSELIPVDITSPSWYPLHLLYFEKRVTSTLELYWLKPGGSGQLDFLPEEAFAHIPG